MLTILLSGDGPPGRRKPLRDIRNWNKCEEGMYIPDVLVMRKRALVRFARPSIFSVPINDVLMVLTALNW